MASEANLKFTVPLPIELDSEQRKIIGEEIIQEIVDRTRSDNKDKNGKDFPGYSRGYMNSLDFNNAGKTERVDLTLSGDMLDELSIVASGVGYVDIGYKPSYAGAGKVEGNVIGSYGKPTGNTKKARNFLGIQKKILDSIVDENSVAVEYGGEREMTQRQINRAVKAILNNVVTNEID